MFLRVHGGAPCAYFQLANDFVTRVSRVIRFSKSSVMKIAIRVDSGRVVNRATLSDFSNEFGPRTDNLVTHLASIHSRQPTGTASRMAEFLEGLGRVLESTGGRANVKETNSEPATCDTQLIHGATSDSASASTLPANVAKIVSRARSNISGAPVWQAAVGSPSLPTPRRWLASPAARSLREPRASSLRARRAVCVDREFCGIEALLL